MKVSDIGAVHLIAAIAQALKIDLNDLILNTTSINEQRQKLRELKAGNIKKVFKTSELNCAVIHWDGKMLPNLVKRKVSDRLPVLITNGDIEKLLRIPELENATGAAQADAILEVVDDWGFYESIEALCCDTTASNLGPWKAALLEKKLEKDVLYLPWRHHIF